jgi:hypothetical protein
VISAQAVCSANVGRRAIELAASSQEQKTECQTDGRRERGNRPCEKWDSLREVERPCPPRFCER